MTRQIIVLKLMLLCFLGYSQDLEKEWNHLVLNEDDHIRLTLLSMAESDIGDSNWLILKIQNKSNKPVRLSQINYSIDKERELESGEKYFHNGEYGRGNEFHLLHYYFDLANPSDYRDSVKINPGGVIFAWKHLTNMASISLDRRQGLEGETCAAFAIKVTYVIKGERQTIRSVNRDFCFDWTNSTDVLLPKLAERLKDVIINQHHRRDVNTNMVRYLTNKEDLFNTISTDELIAGVLIRETIGNTDETVLLLKELVAREEVQNDSIIECLRRKIISNNENVSKELLYYWDNSLLEDLLKSDLYWRPLCTVLEVNSRYWATEAENTQQVYTYLAEKLAFSQDSSLQTENTAEWAKAIKTLSISRSQEFMDYLKTFLDDENEYMIDDWSKYQNYSVLPSSAKPARKSVRICDVAFVSLLRATNQFEFKMADDVKRYLQSMSIKNDVLDDEMIRQLRERSISNNIELPLFELKIKLTPVLKDRILEK